MKIALITDTHFGARNDNLVFADYFYDFWDGVFFPYLRDHDIRQVIHLGDIMDRRKFGNYNTIHRFKTEFLEEFERNNIKLDIIIGNHDTYFKKTNRINSPQQIIGEEDYKTIKVFPDPIERTYDGTKILFLPWINDENRADSEKLIADTDAKIIMGHLELNGFEMYAGHKMDKGEDYTKYSKFDMVMTGHYHHKSTKGNTHYLGSTYEITWHDHGDDRGFHVFDTETGELEYIKNPFKMFHKVYYDDTDVTDHTEFFDSFHFDQYESRYVKVITEAKKDSGLFQRFIDKIQESNPYDLTIVDSFELGTSSSTQVGMVEDTLSLLNEYINTMGDVEEKEKRRLVSLMRTLHSEALEME